jgi:hypothetical protein
MSTKEALIHLKLVSEANNIRIFVLQAITTSCRKNNIQHWFLNLTIIILKKINVDVV